MGQQSNPCIVAQNELCNATRFRNVLMGYPECNSCLKANAAALQNASCTKVQLQTYCGGPVGSPPRVGPHGEKTPPKEGVQMVMKSTDSGLTWSEPKPIAVTNT